MKIKLLNILTQSNYEISKPSDLRLRDVRSTYVGAFTKTSTHGILFDGDSSNYRRNFRELSVSIYMELVVAKQCLQHTVACH